MKYAKQLIWLDGLAGLTVGVLVLAFSQIISRLEGLPIWTVVACGVVNLCYGLYSTTLAARSIRPAPMITFLVVANFSWTPICFLLVFYYWESITLLGAIHLAGEGIFVSALAWQEWKWRDLLRTSN